MEDADLPPDLGTLHSQLQAVGSASNASSTQTEVADVTIVTGRPKKGRTAACAGGGLASGFLNRSKNSKANKEPEMPMLRAKKKAVGTGPEIPDFLRVQPDEREVKLQKHKAELLDKLKPTQDSVSQIMGNPEVLGMFEDAEVMRAVDEIAKNPSAMKKYANNGKVQRFYRLMAGHVADRLQHEGSQQGSAQQLAGA